MYTVVETPAFAKDADRLWTHAARTTEVSTNEVASARLRTGLSQAQFARALKISPRTLQEWEQGRRKPSGAAQALIQIAFRHPEVIVESLSDS